MIPSWWLPGSVVVELATQESANRYRQIGVGPTNDEGPMM